MRVFDTSHLQKHKATDDQPTYEHVYDYADSQANIARIRRHFIKLRTRLILGLVVIFLLPSTLLSFYFHFQFAHTLKKSAILNLAAVAETQKNTIDLYLQERVINLYNLLHSREFTLSPTPENMDNFLQSLKHFNDGFIDIGFINPQGIQTDYAGPYPFLRDTDYRQESWYQTLVTENRNYIISDIRPGIRGIHHFAVAIRQLIDGHTYVIRAALDPEKLSSLLKTISQGKEVESILINRQGQYQTLASGQKRFPDHSDYVPSHALTSGVEEVEHGQQTLFVAHAWLKEPQWALLAMQPMSTAQAGMQQARLTLLISLAGFSMLISAIIYYTINKLVDNARRMAEKGQQLEEMLAHAAKLASTGELASGVAHEINNPLAIIMATSGIIRDMLNPEFGLDHSPEAIRKELTTIDTAAVRIKGITRKLQDMGRSRTLSTTHCDVNALLDETLARLKKVEFKTKHIETATRYLPDLPRIPGEPNALRQVFSNILINAADAIDQKGTITISTAMQESMVSVTIADTGKGIPLENLKRIFNPFFTTKENGKGTGLGLSIAASIVKYMGGTIKVNSVQGAGSSFTILLPSKERSE
ncbi:sensor histidine kinase [Desulfobulbus alkaliphilus]|uniref:sensor histidine kinase n=1 Tax=Desulfobulbus alkaliphilus TaxID=869814 RepID=UPI0019630399|nr:PAS domain-containing sensor histidine kinase [Desulfobulbus alkaliphilus]MBM9537001.1 GHKL domain-containing protein [Desulfobulbus alkaliphilus]